MTSNFLPKKVFIGFDRILNELERVSTHATDSYPPHNVVKYSEASYEIELAIAGFGLSDLSLEIKDNVLTVKGDRAPRRPEEQYVYRGISTRKFLKSFRLSEYTEVSGAKLSDGILSISLIVKIPEEKAPTVITINTDNQSVV